ncbi:hypothetical protein GGD83_004372 [Rhodoblastus sphagnicola]|uniref:glycosyl hydrolase family 28-related protein n=1 Tax=Rhodoblastus sphagnicola TaxID=333368 RepID=UPI001621D958|nr:glycosyl hydrolase family 28-related protein [Rhodoblastus sphagnicola]MBB4200543.1 hypothetical protein [Rhodoblastus sphagnicola]
MLIIKRVLCACVLFLSLAYSANAVASPSIFRASDPVGPDETVVITGADLDDIGSILVQRLPDGVNSGSVPSPVYVEPIQPSSTSVKFIIPMSLGDGVYRFTVSTPHGTASGLLNAPAVFWIQGDGGSCAVPGGSLRIIGRNIARNSNATLSFLKDNDIIAASIHALPNDSWDAAYVLPTSIEPGHYKLRLHNGQGGPFGNIDAGSFEICKGQISIGTVLDVKSYGARGDGETDDTGAIALALEKAGEQGGEVRLPRGRYILSAALRIPPRVILRGERRDLVSLMWKDLDDPPPALIEGDGNFGLEDFTLYASNHRHIISGGCASRVEDGGQVHLRRLTIRASAYRGHLRPDRALLRQLAMDKATGSGADSLRLCGNNIEVVDSDIYGSARVFEFIEPKYAFIARNRFYNGRGGWYAVTGANGVIFENNTVSGGDLTATGGGIFADGKSPTSTNMLFYGNTFERMFGWDREAVTSDGPGGFYYGRAEAVDSRTISIEPTPTTDLTPGSIDFGALPNWAGAALFVLEGRGAGQYATVRSHEGSKVILDSALQVAPNQSSIVTIVPAQSHHIFIRNKFIDAGISAQLYGTAFESYFVENVSERSGGFVNWSLWYHHVQPNWGVQYLRNRVLDGNVYRGGSNSATAAGDSIIGAFVSQSPFIQNPVMRGVIFRANHLEGNAHIEINSHSNDFTTIKDVVVESNRIENADVGVVIHGSIDGLYSRRNSFSDVVHPEVTK